MTAERSFPAIARLLEEAVMLQTRLKIVEDTVEAATKPSVTDKRGVVDLYVDRLRAAMKRGDADDLIKACNAFTTVNKGLQDASWIDDFPDVSAQALEISHQAWAAGDEARLLTDRT